MITEEKVRWRKTDESDWLINCPEHLTLDLVYGRIYTPGASYTYSQTNDFILNFKIKPSELNRLRYKQSAINRFADEVIELFKGDFLNTNDNYFLVPIPPSKSKSHSDYDDRLEQVTKIIAAEFPNVTNFPLVSTNCSGESYHESGKTR
ncbi:MAG: hypothetical protein QNJ41_01935, partial [Xenococcaceae cyanobacterium MO_188.B32]|nr:hypothetical protein [Xenococcaceae cyanobacterium MO_188.B32]